MKQTRNKHSSFLFKAKVAPGRPCGGFADHFAQAGQPDLRSIPSQILRLEKGPGG